MAFELDRKDIEFAFQGQPSWPVMIATIKWPSAAAVRRLYAGFWVELRPTAQHSDIGGIEYEQIAPSDIDFAGFLADHLAGLRRADGQELADSLDEWKTFIREHHEYQIGEQLILKSLFSAQVFRYSMNGDFSLGALQSKGITVGLSEFAEVCEDERGRIVCEKRTDKTTHFLAEASVQQHTDFQDATRTFHTKSLGTKRQIDPILMTQVYRQRVQRIDNATVNGEPCELENKPDWVDLVPYQMISQVMQEDGRGARVENFTIPSVARSAPGG